MEAEHKYISKDELLEEEAHEVERVYTDTEPYSEQAELSRELSSIASSGNGVSRISVPRELNRKRVVTSFHDAFELIGGVPRLAHWADTHPTDFYKLYARLLPTEASQKIEHSGNVVIQHAFPPSKLDGQ